MRKATVKVTGTSPLLFGAPLQSRKGEPKEFEGESDDAFEDRVWLERAHSDGNGTVFLPSLGWKRMLDEAAKRIGKKVKGEGQKRYTKIFEAGVMVTDNTTVGASRDLKRLRVYVPAQGDKGGGKRVWRNFPMLFPWKATVEFHVLDPKLVDEKNFREHLEYGLVFVGMGMWAPRRGGYYGRSKLESMKWETVEIG